MTLYDYDNIIKKKYKYYKKYNSNKILNINLKEFRNIGIEKINKILYLYFSNINNEYVKNVITKKNKIIFLCIDNIFSLENITTILIYHKTKNNKYYILLLGTHEKIRNYGYGKIMLDKFINLIKIKNKSSNIKIILKSTQLSINFYKSYGFIEGKLKFNKLFYKYEPIKELKKDENKILELIL